MLLYSVKKLEFDVIKKSLEKLCTTDYGKYEITLMKFSREKDDVIKNLDCIDEALNILNEKQINFGENYQVWEELKSAKLKNKVLQGIELYKIAKTLQSANKLRSFLRKFNAANLNNIAENINIFDNITDNILTSINRDGEIFDKASKELFEIRAEIRKLKSELETQLENFIRKPDYSHIIQDFIVTQRENRYVIPIKKDHKGKIKGIVLDTSNSGETLFIEPQNIIDKNNKLIEFIKKEKQEIHKILRKLSSHITKNWADIKTTLRVYGKIDLIFSKAHYALENKCSRPKINDKGYWNLKKARHPLLGENAVPIDMSIGDSFIQLIITGPNTGGKTVSVKTIGLLTLMTSAGMFIPANEGSEISVVDTIFIDIGDEQSINQNLSTFSGHIKRILKIIKNSTKKSLILIDELGAGTDPSDGATLGVAILEKLLEIECRVVVTTHFEQIKNFSLFNNMVETASVEFDVKTLTPKYKLLMGIAGRSDALLIAKQLGVPEKIVTRAKEIQNRKSYSYEKILAELNREKSKYISLTNEAEDINLKAKKKMEKILEKEKELKALEKQIKKGEIYESLETVSKAREELAQIKDRIENYKNETGTIENELKNDISKVEKIGRELFDESEKAVIKKSQVDVQELKIGSKVFLSNLQKQGVISNINRKKDEITVRIGSIKIKTNISDISEVINEVENIDKQKSSIFNFKHTIPKPEHECHLRGMRTQDALKKAEEYIEAVIIHDIEKGRIVHGKGEGILRKFIHELLEQHPSIEKFELAHPNEGGWGVTEFWIKN